MSENHKPASPPVAASALWQVSPQATARWRDGHIEISSETSPQQHRWQGGELLALLDDFATPQAIASVVGAHPEYEPAELAALLETFQASGVLVPAAVAASQAHSGPIVEEITPEDALSRLAGPLSTPGLVVEDLGQTVSTCGRSALSPGCQACKDGGWLCAYLGFRCNARCNFCPQPASRAQRDEAHIGTAHVDSMLQFVDENAGNLTGLSLSGGELFLYLDTARVVLRHCAAHHPHLWLWAYSNGIAATPALLAELADLGLRELRLNLAATDWRPQTLRLAEQAVALFPWVTVEVPTSVQTQRRLLHDGLLAWLNDAGVRQLNLAQLCIPLGPDSGPVAQHYIDDGPFYNSGQALYSMPSRLRSLDILAAAHQQKLTLRVNDCSSDAKALQARARRLRWGQQLPALLRHAWPHPTALPGPLAPPPAARREASGLAWECLRPGNGRSRPSPLSWVRVHSTGWTADGQVCDSTWLRADQGQVLPLAAAIAGWKEGVVGMEVGERRLLWIPIQLAYQGQAGQPAGPLLFLVELLEILG